jgi:hypothetical protein
MYICLLQRVIVGKIKGGIEVTGRRGRRRRKLLDDLKERRGYFHLKEEALDRTMWRARYGRGFGPVVRQTKNEMKYALSLNCKTCCRYNSRLYKKFKVVKSISENAIGSADTVTFVYVQ